MQDVTSVGFRDWMQQNVLVALGMTNSPFALDLPTVPSRAAVGHDTNVALSLDFEICIRKRRPHNLESLPRRRARHQLRPQLLCGIVDGCNPPRRFPGQT
jgi:hypothetical protein